MNLFGTIISTFTLVLLGVLALSVVLLFLYYGLFYLRIAVYKGKKTKKISPDQVKNTGVSVVLTVKNDDIFLKENLVYLLEQDHPNYEVIVVNHVSQDYTQYTLQMYKDKYPHLKVMNFTQDVNLFQGRKFPLSIGINLAKNDIILLTDCTCVPKTNTWVAEVASHFASNKTKVVLSFSGVGADKTLLNSFIRYDNLSYMASMFGFALMGSPYTGCGRNLAYRRSFFMEKGGFIQHYNIPTGEDDIFINENASSANAVVCLSKDSYVYSESKKTFMGWVRQKKERMSTQKYYGIGRKFSLFVYPLSVVLFYTSAVLLILQNFTSLLLLSEIVGGVVLLKWIWQILSFYFYARRFGGKKIAFFAPFFEIYFLVMNTIMYFSSLKGKIKRWKQ
ncbi:MAG: glycosyltransferase [Bacteroidales bacterium]|nr:glycosyltransferase [Bacteroidales bacterium]